MWAVGPGLPLAGPSTRLVLTFQQLGHQLWTCPSPPTNRVLSSDRIRRCVKSHSQLHQNFITEWIMKQSVLKPEIHNEKMTRKDSLAWELDSILPNTAWDSALRVRQPPRAPGHGRGSWSYPPGTLATGRGRDRGRQLLVFLSK